MKMKSNLKMLAVVGILLITMCVWNTNLVNATNVLPKDDTTKEVVGLDKTILDLIPNTMSVSIKESQAFDDETYICDVITKQIETILKKNNINLKAENKSFYVDFAKAETIHEFAFILMNQSTMVGTKEITVHYSNSANYNTTDEQYVIEKTKVIHESVWSARDIIQDEPWRVNGDKQTYQEQDCIHTINDLIKDPTIKVKFKPNGMGGSNWSDGIDGLTLFFKNDVLYKIKQINFTRTYMVTIPEDVKDTEKAYIDYAIPKIHQWLEKEWNTNIDSSKITVSKIENSNFYDINVDGSSDSMLIQKANTVKVIDGIAISNVLPNGVNVKVNPIDKNNTTYTTMLDKVKEKGFSNVFVAYDFKLSSGSLKNNLTITFEIDTQYNDRQAIVLHQKQDGSYEEFIETVKNGRISITVKELSPFMVALSDTKVNKEDSTHNKELDDEPKTGTTNYVFVCMTITLLSLGGLGIVKYKK